MLSLQNKRRMLKWIDDASYEELLTRWRQFPTGSIWFQGEVGSHFAQVMRTKREALSISEAAQVSKRVGWKNELVVNSLRPIAGE